MWKLANKTISSRLILGTALFPNLETLKEAIIASGSHIITVSLRRQMNHIDSTNYFWETIKKLPCHILPNTAGCHRADEAITLAEIARELFETNWIKLEVIGDDYNLQPNSIELLTAAESLIKRGFEVFPYCTDDLVICQRLVDIGCNILMPWAAPIGTGKGIINPYALELLRTRMPHITLIIDAGIGKPSHAVQAMELGFDAVLLNSAVATSTHPIQMAHAFKHAVIAGRNAFEAGMMHERNTAKPSTPLIDTPFWKQELI
jgi:thiazole synthase